MSGVPPPSFANLLDDAVQPVGERGRPPGGLALAGTQAEVLPRHHEGEVVERAADSDAEHDGDGRRNQGQERRGRAEDDQRGGRERVIGPSELRPDGGSDRGEHREREDDERREAEHERAGEGAHERGDPEGDPRPSALSVQHARQHVEQGAGEARRGEEVEEERVAVGILIGRLAELLREARQLAEARIRPVFLARVLRRRRRARCDGAGRRAPDVAQAVPLREARDGARVDDTARDAALHDQIAEGAAEIGRRARGHASSQLRNHRDRHACRKNRHEGDGVHEHVQHDGCAEAPADDPRPAQDGRAR